MNTWQSYYVYLSRIMTLKNNFLWVPSVLQLVESLIPPDFTFNGQRFYFLAFFGTIPWKRFIILGCLKACECSILTSPIPTHYKIFLVKTEKLCRPAHLPQLLEDWAKVQPSLALLVRSPGKERCSGTNEVHCKMSLK